MITNVLKNNKKIFLDTVVFIYHFENNPKYIDLTSSIFSRIEQGLNSGLTSQITLAEILIKPHKLNEHDKAQDYQIIFQEFPNLLAADIDHDCAKIAALLSAKYNLELPDALQIGSAISNNASIFITNDLKLKRVNEIEIVALDDFFKSD